MGQLHIGGEHQRASAARRLLSQAFWALVAGRRRRVRLLPRARRLRLLRGRPADRGRDRARACCGSRTPSTSPGTARTTSALAREHERERRGLLAGGSRRHAADRELRAPTRPRRPAPCAGAGSGAHARPRREARSVRPAERVLGRRDLQVVAERPVDEALRAHRVRAPARARAGAPAGSAAAPSASSRTRSVAGAEGVVAPERRLARLRPSTTARSSRPQARPKYSAVRIPSAVSGRQWPAESPTMKTPSSVAGRSACGIQLPWKPSGALPRSAASSTVGSLTW